MEINMSVFPRMKLDNCLIIPPEQFLDPAHVLPRWTLIRPGNRHMLPSLRFRITLIGESGT